MISKSLDSNADSASSVGYWKRFTNRSPLWRSWLQRFIDADHHNIEGRRFAETIKGNLIQHRKS